LVAKTAPRRCCEKLAQHKRRKTFHRRSIVEGFFGPLRSMAHRAPDERGGTVARGNVEIDFRFVMGEDIS
jgi:hypothetical protein